MLPVANLHLKAFESSITDCAIQGASVYLTYRAKVRDSTDNKYYSHDGEETNIIRSYSSSGNSYTTSPNNQSTSTNKAVPQIDVSTFVTPQSDVENEPHLMASVNEALAWRKVLPFLPNMSGEFISFL